MGFVTKIIIVLFIVVDIIIGGFILLSKHSFPILNPAGQMALQERNVLFLLGGIGLFIVTIVVISTFLIFFKFREENKKTTRKLDFHNSKKIEFLRWGFMCVLIGFFSIVTWISVHSIDPYKPINSSTKPITIQVVSLQWRWLFIYPDQNIATINFIEFPEKTPINFELTSDAPMNSFWIPALGGQIYTMSGMSTQTHLIANKPGDFQGSSAEISGKGFSDMKFVARATSQANFDSWVDSIQNNAVPLTYNDFKNISKPSTDSTVKYFYLRDKNLYNEILMQFTTPNSMGNMKM